MKTWLTSVPVWILVSSTLPLIIGSFLVCQIPLHNRMLEYKKNELLRIENLLQKELEIHKFNDFTEERRAKIDFLERRKSFFYNSPSGHLVRGHLLASGHQHSCRYFCRY